MKALGIVAASAVALLALTGCVPEGFAAAGSGGSNFCAAFADHVTVNVENLPILASGDAAAKRAAEQRLRDSEDAVVALAPSSIRSDVEILMADARAGRSEAGAPSDVATSDASGRVAEYVTTNCLGEGLELLKKLGENAPSVS